MAESFEEQRDDIRGAKRGGKGLIRFTQGFAPNAKRRLPISLLQQALPSQTLRVLSPSRHRSVLRNVGGWRRGRDWWS